LKITERSQKHNEKHKKKSDLLRIKLQTRRKAEAVTYTMKSELHVANVKMLQFAKIEGLQNDMQKILGAIMKILEAMATWRPGFMQAWF
jgi:hypothetical protein